LAIHVRAPSRATYRCHLSPIISVVCHKVKRLRFEGNRIALCERRPLFALLAAKVEAITQLTLHLMFETFTYNLLELLHVILSQTSNLSVLHLQCIRLCPSWWMSGCFYHSIQFHNTRFSAVI